MTLSDVDIARSVSTIVSPPPRPDALQPASIDLSLGSMLLVPIPRFAGTTIDIRRHRPADLMRRVSLGEYTLAPGCAALGTTAERITVPYTHIARVEGRSTLARIFLIPHAAAGFIDPGFCGEVTLELVNLGPWAIQLYVGMPIAQLSIAELSSPAARAYGDDGLHSHYQNQTGATAAVGERGTDVLKS